MAAQTTQLAVIGGGPGGYAAAFLAADLGMDVTLVDPEENPGGVCLYRGCIPSKALLHVARVIHESREAKDWGVTFRKPQINVDKMRGWKDDVVQKLTGGLGQLAKRRNVTHVRGKAMFVGPTTVEIKREEGPVRLKFEHAIVATGSHPVTLPFAPDSERILNSKTALDLEDIPKSLLVIGGGYIGLELGTVYAALGSKVTIVEMMPQLLPGVDKDLVRILHKRLEGAVDAIMLNTTVKELKEQKNGIKAVLEGDDEDTKDRIFEKVLISVGRKPNSRGFGLESTKIEFDDKGFVKVDAQRRTAEPTIYAIGDVAGEPMLAHKASHEGRVAVRAIAGESVAYEPRAIPAVVFTDPEVAWCGLTENQAKDSGHRVEVARFPWAASGRATTIGRNEGVTKLIIDPESERILGMGIVGPGAGELIAEGVLAVEMAATAEDLGMTIHPHPTLSETIMNAADVFFGTATDYYRPKKNK